MIKVAPNPTHFQKHVMQFFTKLKHAEPAISDTSEKKAQSSQVKQKAAREYLAKLKQEIEMRRDEQIKRN